MFSRQIMYIKTLSPSPIINDYLDEINILNLDEPENQTIDNFIKAIDIAEEICLHAKTENVYIEDKAKDLIDMFEKAIKNMSMASLLN